MADEDGTEYLCAWCGNKVRKDTLREVLAFRPGSEWTSTFYVCSDSCAIHYYEDKRPNIPSGHPMSFHPTPRHFPTRAERDAWFSASDDGK